MIIGKNVSLKLKNKIILDDVSFQIEKGRITSFIGKSGAGKTSLLKCIANLYSSYSGIILLEEKDTKKLSKEERVKHVGFVSQSFNLFPHMTVLKNCIHPLMFVLGMGKEQAVNIAEKTLESLDISALKYFYPSQISGGQQQRVAIARALCLHPEFLLFDEPTSALDPESTKSLQELLKKLCDKGIGIALSTHDMPFVKNILDSVYFLENGKIIDFFDIKKDSLVKNSKIYDFLNHG